MATDWGALKQGAGITLWSAWSLFLEGLFWVFLHLVSKVAGLVQQGVENFILVARGSGVVHEHCPEQSNCNCCKHFTKLGYDFVSPPIYGYRPVATYVPNVKLSSRFSIPIGQATEEGVGTSIGRANVPIVKLESVVPQVNADDNVQAHAGSTNRTYSCNVPDLNHRSNIPHFVCNFLGHTRKKWYAVAKGRKIGIFKCWEVVEEQVKGFSGHKQHSFKAHAEAEDWYRFKLLGLA